MKHSLSRLISILYRKNQAYLNDVMMSQNLTSTETMVLMFLYKHQQVTQEDIVHYLQLDKASITRTIQSLIKKGYVVKKKDLHDKRCNNIFLSEKGMQLETLIVNKLEWWNELLLQDFTEEEQQFLYGSLLSLVEKIEKREGQTYEGTN
ncbi:MarR family transcriptional regulator [Enterococcus florum]|uniref:MarR family transcriptional regulator n=1 Tax=Enterococcus florum TaxID=2480627 RepID=A0A4P5PAJ2_9ENTE|nr:MarR family transcriptional regulator [Enterococcus florum]GCF93271.1 MarR family transcriptional regulator [Enterococcus florum]